MLSRLSRQVRATQCFVVVTLFFVVLAATCAVFTSVPKGLGGHAGFSVTSSRCRLESIAIVPRSSRGLCSLRGHPGLHQLLAHPAFPRFPPSDGLLRAPRQLHGGLGWVQLLCTTDRWRSAWLDVVLAISGRRAFEIGGIVLALARALPTSTLGHQQSHGVDQKIKSPCSRAVACGAAGRLGGLVAPWQTVLRTRMIEASLYKYNAILLHTIRLSNRFAIRSQVQEGPHPPAQGTGALHNRSLEIRLARRRPRHLWARRSLDRWHCACSRPRAPDIYTWPQAAVTPLLGSWHL